MKKLFCAAILLAACGGSSSSTTGDLDAASSNVTLTINDYLSWCNVSVNGAPVSTKATQTLTYAPGAVINLSGDTESSASFSWGYWTGTAGDTTATHDTAKMTTVTLSANKTVEACCPAIGSTTCP